MAVSNLTWSKCCGIDWARFQNAVINACGIST